jgi:predicted ester cyclase
VTDHETLIRRWIEEGVNGGNHAVLDEIIHPNMVNHEDVSGIPGREGFKGTMATFKAALADQRMEILDVISGGDKVVVRLRWIGRPGRIFMGRPTNGNAFNVTHTHTFRVEDGMLAEHWANRDDFGMWRQISDDPFFKQ